MLRRDAKTIRGASGDLQSLVSEFQERIGIGELKDEEDITSRLLERLQSVLSFQRNGLSVQTKAFTVGKRKEEPTLGADILVVTSYSSPKIQISKGFLAQAKNLELSKPVYGQKMRDLKDQCSNMLKHSIESYVWLYSGTSIRSHKAYQIEALSSNKPDDLSYSYLKNFLVEFLICRHGDPQLNLESVPRIKRLVEDLNVRHTLFVQSQSDDEGGPPRGEPPAPDDDPPNLSEFLKVTESVPIQSDEHFIQSRQADKNQTHKTLQKKAELPPVATVQLKLSRD